MSHSQSPSPKPKLLQADHLTLQKYLWTQNFKHNPNNPKVHVRITSVPTKWNDEKEHMKKNAAEDAVKNYYFDKSNSEKQSNEKKAKKTNPKDEWKLENSFVPCNEESSAEDSYMANVVQNPNQAVSTDASKSNLQTFAKALPLNNVFDLGFKMYSHSNEFNICPCAKLFATWRSRNSLSFCPESCSNKKYTCSALLKHLVTKGRSCEYHKVTFHYLKSLYSKFVSVNQGGRNSSYPHFDFVARNKALRTNILKAMSKYNNILFSADWDAIMIHEDNHHSKNNNNVHSLQQDVADDATAIPNFVVPAEVVVQNNPSTSHADVKDRQSTCSKSHDDCNNNNHSCDRKLEGKKSNSQRSQDNVRVPRYAVSSNTKNSFHCGTNYDRNSSYFSHSTPYMGQDFGDDNSFQKQKQGRKSMSSLESSKYSSKRTFADAVNCHDNSSSNKSTKQKISHPHEAVKETALVPIPVSNLKKNDVNSKDCVVPEVKLDVLQDSSVHSKDIHCQLSVKKDDLDDLLVDYGIMEVFHELYQKSTLVTAHLGEKSRTAALTLSKKIITFLKRGNVFSREKLWTNALLQTNFFIHDANCLEMTRHVARVVRIFYTSRISIDCVVFRIDIDGDGGLGIIVELEAFLKLFDSVMHLPISQMYNKFNGMTKIQNMVLENETISKPKKHLTNYFNSSSPLHHQHQNSKCKKSNVPSIGFSHFFTSKSNSSSRSNHVSSALLNAHDLSVAKQRVQIRLTRAGSNVSISKKDKFFAESMKDSVVQTYVDTIDLISANKSKQKLFFLGTPLRNKEVEHIFPRHSILTYVGSIKNVKIVNTLKGCVCYNNDDLVFVLVPRKESVRMRHPKCYIDALAEIEKNYKIKKSD